MTTPTNEATHDATNESQPSMPESGLLEKAKDLFREGNRRRLVVKSADGRNLLEIPLTIAVIATVLLPVWIAVGLIVAIVTDASIEMERPDRLVDLPASNLAGEEVPV